MELPAVSLHQPWASLLFHPTPDPLKKHETRSWAPRSIVGRRTAIHAAKQRIVLHKLDPDLITLCTMVFGPGWEDRLPLGAVIGSVIFRDWRKVSMPAALMTDVEPADIICGDWSIGRIVWRAIEPILLAEPIPWSGQQGLFKVEVPDHG